MIWFLDQLALPVVNYGWYGNVITASRATLDVWLSAEHDYQIQITLPNNPAEKALMNTSLSVNGERFPLTGQLDANQNLTLTGQIPREAVARDATQTLISFNIPDDAHNQTDRYFYAFEVDRLTILPTNNSSP